jgi:predicted enzyme related to lactoylglutathione lyase
MANPVVHFEIIGENKQLLEAFYTSVFDWKISAVMDEYSLVDTGSSPGGGIGAMGQAQRHVTFYVEVADVNTALAEIEAKGGKRAFGPHPVPTGATIAGFTDPEGNLVGLVQQGKTE